MQIEGTKVTHEQVKLNVRPADVWAKLRRSILNANGMHNVEYMRQNPDGTPCFKQDDPHHRHGSISEEMVIEKPTAQQIEVWEALLIIDDQVKRVQSHEG